MSHLEIRLGDRRQFTTITTRNQVLDKSCLSDGHTAQLLDRLQAAMRDRFDTDHSTLQFELAERAAHEAGAH